MYPSRLSERNRTEIQIRWTLEESPFPYLHVNGGAENVRVSYDRKKDGKINYFSYIIHDYPYV